MASQVVHRVSFIAHLAFFCSADSGSSSFRGLFSLPEGSCAAACNLGSWSISMTRCVERACTSRPSIAYADQGSLEACRGTRGGGYCAYTCRKGWHRTNDIACKGGVWGSAACLPDRCR